MPLVTERAVRDAFWPGPVVDCDVHANVPAIEALFPYMDDLWVDWTLERASLSLGVSPFRTTLKVVLPVIGTAVGVAAFLAFLHSFDELLIALFISGIQTSTLPKKMWESLQEINPTITAVSTLLIAFTVLSLALIAAMQAWASRANARRELD